MSRYIDVDALIEAMGEEPYVWTDSDDEIAERNQWLTDMHIIENAPSIDIVRCKECKHYDKFPTWSACTYWSGDPYEQASVNPNDFCSYGERREP